LLWGKLDFFTKGLCQKPVIFQLKKIGRVERNSPYEE
jgi:hypothetical protein